MSTHNICFHGEIRNIMWLRILSGAMFVTDELQSSNNT